MKILDRTVLFPILVVVIVAAVFALYFAFQPPLLVPFGVIAAIHLYNLYKWCRARRTRV